MAEIKIRRKPSIAWWPVLLLLLVPLAWYLYHVSASRGTAVLPRDTGTVPATLPLPSATSTHATLPPPPVASSAPAVTSTDVSTPVTSAPPTTRPVARPPAPARH